jgi:hypothetical protein
MRSGICLVGLIWALPVMGGALYVEGFPGGAGTSPNGWSSSGLAIHADPRNQDNRAFGLAPSTRIRPVEPPGAVRQSEVAVYEAVLFPGDVALRISSKLLAEGRGAIALLLLDGSTREPVLTLERTSKLRIEGARGELILDSPPGWAELAVELSPGVLTVGGPAGQLTLPLDLPQSFLLAVRASGPLALIDDIRIETSDDGPLPSDRSPPKIAVFANGSPLTEGLLAGAPVEIVIEIEDESQASFETTLDGAAFHSGVVAAEGPHQLRVEARDEHGNRAVATFTFTLDLSPPEIEILERPPLCTNGTGVVIRGSVADAHLDTIELITAEGQRPLQPDPAGIWEVRIDDLAEGAQATNVRATDQLGRATSALVTTTVDRTPPTISILMDGVQADDGLVANRPIAPFVTVDDADSGALLSVLLDDAPWTAGRAIDGDGVHLLQAEAIDCAGNVASRGLTVEIDTKPPVFESIDPSHGSELGEMPLMLRGRVSADATSVTIAGSGTNGMPVDGVFAIPIVADEGENRYVLRAVDRAGNEATREHRFTINTRAPSIEILEGESPLIEGSLFNREVRLEARSSDPDAALVAELNGVSFEPGTIVSIDGAYTVTASATNPLGHRRSATRSFRIDATPPLVAITSPRPGVVAGDAIPVEGTSGDSVSVNVSGIPAVVGGGRFEAIVPIDGDEQLIVAMGRDAAGNQGRDEVLVRRGSLAPGIVLTSPADGTVTNRPTVRVTGRVLSPSLVESVTVGSSAVSVDPAGNFVLDAFALNEGSNAITTTAISTNGRSSAVTVSVIADRTPPVLRIFERGAPMADQARFASVASLSLEAIDEGSIRSSEARMNGVIISMPASVTTPGGHTIAAVATDAAGNETRVERTFFIGGGSGGGCRLESFVPATGSIVGATVTGLTGRTGGAAGVKVNGVPATVSDGSFCATVELPLEGTNEVLIVCTDAEENPVGIPQSITLTRSTQLPSVTINSPPEGAPTESELVSVGGIAGPGVVEVTVNGRAATIAEGDPNAARAWTVDEVRLVSGLNILLAKGRTASMKRATASRRIIYLKDGPALSVTSPLPGATIGNPSVSISGTYRNLDPATLAVPGSAASAEVHPLGDAEGSFLFRNVALQPGANAVVITGSDVIGRMTSAAVEIMRADTAPFVAIADPIDHAIFGASSGSIFSVTGTAIAAPGATIDVAGAPATIVATEVLSSSRTSYSFSAEVTFATFGVTPVVARVTEPSGASATHAIRVTKLAEAPRVTQTFPDDLAVSVDPGAMIVVVFSSPMDRASLASAFRLETAAGSPVAGTTRFDRGAITFASSAPLGAGEYRIRIAASAADAGGEPLATEYASSFRAAPDAPSTAPTLDALPARVCDSTITIAGTAAAGARVRLDLGTLTLTTTADATGRFSFAAPLSGPSGYQLVQVRTIGADGTLSPAAQACLLTACGGLEVVSASYDRTINSLTVAFSGDVDPATVTVGDAGSIRLRLTDGTFASGTATTIGSNVTIAPSSDITQLSFTLEVTTSVRAIDGTALRTPFSQNFPFSRDEPPAGDGSGFISGQVFDASTGRPLAGATISLTAPVNAYKSDPSVATMSVGAQAIAGMTDLHGRYTLRLPEGPHTLALTADGYTTVWRQIIVAAGRGVTPIDIRLTPSSAPVEITGAATLTNGGETAVTASAKLEIPSGGITSGTALTFTSVGAQSLAGLLPLGWSPIASVEIDDRGAGDGGQGAGAPLVGTLSFGIDAAAVSAAAQTLTLVRYDSARDEWRVITPVVAISGNTASSPITSTGAYALVYPDALAPRPSSLAPGSALIGLADPCATNPCTLTATSFTLNPTIVLPTQTSVATLIIDGAPEFPSGTAVQAWIDEELRLSDGSVLLDPPFAADLILYRSLDGTSASAVFAIAPSARAAEVILEIGYDRLNVLPYPGRLARGTLIGNEGGRIPGDGSVVVEIPAGATIEPIRASSASLTSQDLAAFGSIAGFRILGGFALELERASDAPQPDLDGDGVPDAIAVQLTSSARVTFNVDPTQLPSGAEVLVAEVLGGTPYGPVIRLAARAIEVAFDSTEAKLFTTRPIDRALLPLDGVVREGRYLFLAAEQPIAFATGAVRRGAAAPYIEGALVTASPLGIQDFTRVTGLFSIPVLAAPSTPFTLTARHQAMGEGTPYLAATSPDPSSIVAIGDFILVPQSPRVTGTAPAPNAVEVPLTTTVRIQFDRALDPTSITPDTVVVTDAADGSRVEGTTSLDGASALLWTSSLASSPFAPSSRYDVTVSAQTKATTGAPLGSPYAFTFTTITTLSSTEVRPERISITIPQDGVSTIRGAVGALPSGWQAVAVRRGKDFVVRYQATAAADGSFSFAAGDCGGIAKRAVGRETANASLFVDSPKGAGGGGQEAGLRSMEARHDSELSGSLGLEEVDGSSRSRTRRGDELSEEGKRGSDITGSPGGDVDSVEYRRGTYEGIDERIFESSVDRAGVAGRGRDLPDARGKIPLDPGRTFERPSGSLLRTGSNAVRVAQLASLGAGEPWKADKNLNSPKDDGSYSAALAEQPTPASGPLPPVPFDPYTQMGAQAISRPLALAGFASICSDSIHITDAIDLKIFNAGGALSALVPLTPFISEDRRSFIASPNARSTVTTPEGITVAVPAGAFDQPTLVTALRKQKEAIARVPDLDDEVNWSASIELKFDCPVGRALADVPCRAKKRIDLELPTPDADPAKIHILALVGQSIRGPRLMAMDTLRVVDGKLVTAAEPAGKLSADSTSSVSTATSLAPRPSSLAPFNVKPLLLGATYPGVYSAVDVKVPAGTSMGWAVIEGLALGQDLFWDSLDSFYAADFYLAEGRGRIAIPVLKGLRFTVTGVDSATGLDAFQKIYDPLPVGDPGAVITIETPNADTQGPYPIFATPFRIETLDLNAEKVDLTGIRNFVVRLEGGLVKVTDAASPVAASVPVTLLNVGTGQADADRGDGLIVAGKLGDRIVLLIGRQDVDPDTSISAVFSEPLALGEATTPDEIDAFLRTKLEVRKLTGSSFETVTALFRFGIDSGARRIHVESRGALHRGATYRLEFSKTLADASGLAIGQVMDEGEVKGGLASNLILQFTTRSPVGEIGNFDIVDGSIRDLARSGNTLFVSALDGGLRAFDIADAAVPKPLGVVPKVVDDSWAVAVDGHDRVFTTMLGNLFGGVRTYRAEDFRSATSSPPGQIGAAIVSWAPGYQGSLGLASANVLVDRPEAIPRKLQIVSQDNRVGPLPRDEFKASAGVAITKVADHPGGFEEWSVSVSHDPALSYLVQRVTIENRDAGFRWSADTGPGSPAVLGRVLARESDRLVLIRNQRSYGVISLFGHGVGVFDLNAIESNDAPEKPETWKSLRENLLLTSAQLEESACGHPSPDSGAIRDLAFTPEAAILAHETVALLQIYALDANRGILDLRVSPWTLTGDGLPFCTRGPTGLLFHSKGTTPPDDPRLHSLRSKFEALANRPPFARFNGISTHGWRIESGNNVPVVPGGKIGQRGTPAGSLAQRDYLLVAGNEYGLLVVDAPKNNWLGPQHLADVIWIPAGAASVRTIPGSDLATVVDGEGHLLLVDLSRIDERWNAVGVPIEENAMFPTLAVSLSKSGSYGTGLEDPRIIWRSEEPVASGTLAPLIDPDLGIVIAARLLGKTLRLLSTIDPRLRVMIDIDGVLREVSGVIPLGVS